MKTNLSELLFPRRCPFCDGLLGRDEPWICRGCSQKIKWIRGPVCLKCGRPLEDDRKEYCEACRNSRHFFEQGYAPFVYEDRIQTSLMRFKYGGRAEYARFYAHAAAAYGRDLLRRWQPELIIPVPVHFSRYVKRGYNQAGVFAQALSEELRIPADGNSVLRVRNTRPQKGLDPKERKKNLHHSFAVREGTVFPEKVLLADDIYTTGATMDELARTVLAHGAKQAWFVCVSVAAGRD